MCNRTCILFGATNLTNEEIRSKRVLEVGSIDVNGNLRPTVEALGPREYVGVDIEQGRGVDVVCRAEDILNKFGKESFDAVISTEMLEHIRDWRTVVSNIKNVCRPGGVVLLTTRSYGFKYHGYPHDFWRYELADMKHIFSDFEIQALQGDPEMPGVLIKAKKPEHFSENDLSSYRLYSIVTNKKMIELRDEDFNNFYFKRLKFKIRLRDLRKKVKSILSFN
jgi:SAM-dependent methyltransferase